MTETSNKRLRPPLPARAGFVIIVTHPELFTSGMYQLENAGLGCPPPPHTPPRHFCLARFVFVTCIPVCLIREISWKIFADFGCPHPTSSFFFLLPIPFITFALRSLLSSRITQTRCYIACSPNPFPPYGLCLALLSRHDEPLFSSSNCVIVSRRVHKGISHTYTLNNFHPQEGSLTTARHLPSAHYAHT